MENYDGAVAEKLAPKKQMVARIQRSRWCPESKKGPLDGTTETNWNQLLDAIAFQSSNKTGVRLWDSSLAQNIEGASHWQDGVRKYTFKRWVYPTYHKLLRGKAQGKQGHLANL